ncbi:MAG: MOSC domain-containing protein [Sulfurovum sp.]|nr:MOSC domain-containing protein [Sulfurovum sp.]
MKKVGKVIELFISEVDKKSRTKKNTINLDAKGITTDKFYDKDRQRSVLITSIDSYTLMQNHHITAQYGSLGENLLVDFNPYHLVPGTQLQIGQSVILEISQYCTICNHLSTIHETVPALLKNDRGIFAKILASGIIAQGDNIFLLEN